MSSYCFFFYDTATTEIYTLSLHDALPISFVVFRVPAWSLRTRMSIAVLDLPMLYLVQRTALAQDRKSTRLNSSHVRISYAVFCLKKKKLVNIVSQATNSLEPVTWCSSLLK